MPKRWSSAPAAGFASGVCCEGAAKEGVMTSAAAISATGQRHRRRGQGSPITTSTILNPTGLNPTGTGRPSHIRIVRPAAAFGHYPIDILLGVLDVAGLAVHAVLRVDLQPLAVDPAPWPVPWPVIDDLVDPGGTIALFGRIVEAVID